jgi:hypothetical protein
MPKISIFVFLLELQIVASIPLGQEAMLPFAIDSDLGISSYNV